MRWKLRTTHVSRAREYRRRLPAFTHVRYSRTNPILAKPSFFAAATTRVTAW